MPNGQFPAIIELSSLNGKNGFKLDGEDAPPSLAGQSGYSVSAAGDINGDDIADLVIGAPYYTGDGRSYVVFGGSTVGGSGLLSLSTLNGANGFKLDGEGGLSGWSVSGLEDINGDEIADLVIGAPYYNNYAGRSYVVFGGSTVGDSGLLSLSTLNGTSGFKLDGEGEGGLSGTSVSGMGDINGDETADLVIGAYFYNNYLGRIYVVFGGSTVGDSGLLSLSALNGVNGFKLDGESGSKSGYSVNGAGDINGDKIVDLIIGAPYYYDNIGRSYVVFGGSMVSDSGLLSLSALNGTNGFKLNSEGESYSGWSVSEAGDINGDEIADLLVGAPYFNNVGRSYVVFGDSTVVNSGLLSLSALNGTNGFKLDGENNNASGWSVSGAGDINGDKIADLVIGAPYNSNSGCSYVVFGGSTVGNSGLLSLSGLNGTNGFKLDGESDIAFGYSGYSVSGSGDINGDEITDLVIGAPYYNNSTGRSYVIFGDVPPVLVNNSLSLNMGEIVHLNPIFLAAFDQNHNNGSLVFSPSNILHGQFEAIINPGVPIANFTQQQIWDSDIQFTHDGSPDAPSYNITVHSDGIAWTGPLTANVSMAFVRVDNNQLVINQGQTVILTSQNLSADDKSGYNPNLIFTISNIQQGRFAFVSSSSQPVTQFQQQNVIENQVSFMHDNSQSAPSYSVVVTDGVMSSPVQAASIDFDAEPVLVNNQLTINQGQVVTLVSENLYATHATGNESELSFLISDCQHGFFAWIFNLGQAITLFQQQNITDNLIEFVHDNSQLPPAYSVAVTDGRISSPLQAASIDFDAEPVLVNNELTINQGQMIALTSVNLYATHATGDESELSFLIKNCQHGYFEWVSKPGQAITVFQQQNITDNLVGFVHDNSQSAPAYSVVVTDMRMNSSAQAASIDFDLLPVLENNQLWIDQGQTVILTSDNLKAAHNGSVDGNLSFIIQNLQHGYFQWVNYPSDPIAVFQQQNITDSQVSFVHDNSQSAPAYKVSVSDGRAISDPSSAGIYFSAEDSGDLSDGLIAGIAVMGTAALLGLIYGFYKYCRKTKKDLFQPLTASSSAIDSASSVERAVLNSSAVSIKTASIPASDFDSKTEALSFNIHQSADGLSKQADNKVVSLDPLELKLSLNLVAFKDLHFNKKDKLGAGAYGVVYRGDYNFNQVAIKQLYAKNLSAEALVELKQEAAIMESMRSDYIVPLRGVCLEKPHYCLVMQLMPKGSLYHLLENNSGLPESVVLRIALDIISGLCQLHKAGILHRDLKSLNVLLDDGLRAKIGDFGLSKMKSEVSSQSAASPKGTLAWMAPELCDEKPASVASDIYAFGMVLWELMVRPYQIPFQGLSSRQIMAAKLRREEKQEEQEKIPPNCPREISGVIKSCWQIASKRPTAEDLVRSLQPIFAAAEQKAKPASSSQIEPLARSLVPSYGSNLESAY